MMNTIILSIFPDKEFAEIPDSKEKETTKFKGWRGTESKTCSAKIVCILSYRRVATGAQYSFNILTRFRLQDTNNVKPIFFLPL